jgi:DNA end-binding protein Ku
MGTPHPDGIARVAAARLRRRISRVRFHFQRARNDATAVHAGDFHTEVRVPRSVWKGAISFGLVTIGVELYNAEAPERLDLDLLDKRDMARIGYRKINKRTGKEVESANIVRGYGVGGDKYVLLTDEDLREANPKATRTIEVLGFLPEDAIPQLYYDKPYITAPTKGSEKAYTLFRGTLEAMKQVALAQVVLRTRQYLAVVYPYQHMFVTHLLRYHEEVRTPESLDLEPPKAAARPAETAMAKKLVQGMAIEWEPEEYRDTYRDDLLKLIKQRAKGAKPVHEVAEDQPETKVIDLMDALRRSVSNQGTRKHAAPARRKRAAKSA